MKLHYPQDALWVFIQSRGRPGIMLEEFSQAMRNSGDLQLSGGDSSPRAFNHFGRDLTLDVLESACVGTVIMRPDKTEISVKSAILLLMLRSLRTGCLSETQEPQSGRGPRVQASCSDPDKDGRRGGAGGSARPGWNEAWWDETAPGLQREAPAASGPAFHASGRDGSGGWADRGLGESPGRRGSRCEPRLPSSLASRYRSSHRPGRSRQPVSVEGAATGPRPAGRRGGPVLGHDPPPQQAGLSCHWPDLGQVGEHGVADRHLVERKQVVRALITT